MRLLDAPLIPSRLLDAAGYGKPSAPFVAFAAARPRRLALKSDAEEELQPSETTP